MATLTGDMLKTRSGQFDVESIQRVSVARMALGTVDILKGCTSLVSLDLSDNMVANIEQLGTLPKLRSLNLSGNRISSLAGIEGLCSLEHLQLEGNAIRDLAELERLACLTNLRSLSLRSRDHKKHNPVCSHPTYFTQVQRVLGSHKLQQVDGENLILRDTAQRLMLENASPDESDITLPPAEAWNHERLLRMPPARKTEEVLELETDLAGVEDEAKALDAEAAVLISKLRADAAARVKEAKAKMKAENAATAKISSTRRAERNS